MFICEFCGKLFTDQWKLNRHVDSIHKGIQYNCELCSAVFRWRDNLRRHVRQKHENGRMGEMNMNQKKEEKKDGEVLTESLEKRLLWEYEEKKRKIELGRRILNITYKNNMKVGLLEGEDKEALNMYFEYGHI